MLNLGFFSSAVCAVETMLHGQPSAMDVVGSAAHLPQGCAGIMVLLPTWGWLCVLQGSLTASQQHPLNTAFSTSTGLHALPVESSPA